MPDNPKQPVPPKPTVLRDEKGRLVKGGANLNPGGRPKGLREAIKASSYGDPVAFVDLLTKAIDGQWGDLGPRERWDAVKVFAAYAYGRPVESLAVLTGNLDDAPDLSLPLGDLIALAKRPLATRPADQTVEGKAIPTEPLEDAETE